LAAGQVTPGPVVITATFIGYRVAGFLGAIAATLSIFASAFINVLVVLPFIEKKLTGSPKLKGFTDWAFPAVIGGIAATTLKLSLATVTTTPLAILLVITALIVFWKKPPAWAVIPLSGLGYFLLRMVV
jgi:chromate transporter